MSLASASDSLQSRHSTPPHHAVMPIDVPPPRHLPPPRLSPQQSSGSKVRPILSSSRPLSNNSYNSALAQPPTPTPHRMERHTSNNVPAMVTATAALDTSASVPALVAPRPRGVGALYALATSNDVGGNSSRRVTADGLCTCVLCARVRREWSFGSDQSGWGWGDGARAGPYAVPANCTVGVALDSVCAKQLANFAAAAAGVDKLPLYKLHVRRTVYLLASASAAAARALTSREEDLPEAQSAITRMQRRMPSFRRGSVMAASSTGRSERQEYGARGPPFADMREPMWGLLNARGDAWRPLSVSERMDIRAVVRSAKSFLERHAGPGCTLAPDEFAALIAEIAITTPVPPVASWNRAPRWQSRALSGAHRSKMTPADSKLWANRMRDYLSFISDSTGIPIEVLRQLNAHCLDLAHMLAITGECERSRSIRARSSSVSADSLRERNATPPPMRRSSLRQQRSLSPLGNRMSFGGNRQLISEDENEIGAIPFGSQNRNRRFNRWCPLKHTERTLLRIEMAQMYRYIHSFAVQDPCADYPDELAAILAEVYVTWPVPAGMHKARHPRWSHKAVPETDWSAAGFIARQAYRLRARKYLRFISEKTGVQPSYARKLDADSFDRLHASAIFHDIDTSAELYQTKLQPNNATPDDPVANAMAREAYGGWTSPVQSGSTVQRSSEAATLPLPVEEVEEDEVVEYEEPTEEAGATLSDERGYTFNSLSDTAERDAENPRPLTMSRRARMEHEVDEARWYLDCAKNAASSFASNLQDAAEQLSEGTDKKVEAVEELSKNSERTMSPDRNLAQAARRRPRQICSESVSSGESLREWLMRVESQEAQYSWECAACRGTGANPQRKTAPRWHWASLGVEVTEKMDSKARKDWELHAKKYLEVVSRLTGVDEAELRAASAEQFERWHIDALRAFAAMHNDMPCEEFAPSHGNEVRCRSMPHTRAFIARILGVPESSMSRLSDDECTGILSVQSFDGMTPFGIDRQSYPPWHHRSVPMKEWTSMAEAQRRERRMHFRKEILAIARRYSVPPLVVTELDARTYRLVANGVGDDCVKRIATEEDIVESAPVKDAGATTPATEVTTEGDNFMQSILQPVSHSQEVLSTHTCSSPSAAFSQNVVSSRTSSVLQEEQPALNVSTPSSPLPQPQSPPQSQRSVVPLQGAPPPSLEDAVERVPTPVNVSLGSDSIAEVLSALEKRAESMPHSHKRAVRFEDAEEEVGSEGSGTLAPVVNITRAEGATNEMYRRSLLSFATQMAGDEAELEEMSTAELVNIVRMAVSTAFRAGGNEEEDAMKALELMGVRRD